MPVHVLPLRALRVLLVLGLLGLPALLLGASPSEATHFRANQISWVRTAPDTAAITVTGSWRSSFFFFGTPSVGDTFSPGCFELGDGDVSCEPFTVTRVDAANDVLSGEVEVVHTYPGPGPWTVRLESCCRLSSPLHVNNADGGVLLQSLVDLAATSSSPVSQVSPIVDCARDALCTFRVPALDADGQALRYRLATGPEAGGVFGSFVQPGPPYAPQPAGIDAAGVYTWDTRGAQVNQGGDTFYSTQVVVENVVGGRIVATTPVDFFVRLGGTANRAPEWDAASPGDGRTFETTAGDAVSFTVSASDPDAADTVTFDVLGATAAVALERTPGNPSRMRVTYTPTRAEEVLLTVTPRDQQGLGATQRSFVLVARKAATRTEARPALAEVQPTAVHAPALSARLTRTDGRPLAGRTVEFRAGTTLVCSAPTGTDGVATCGGLLGVPAVVLARGYTASFAGDDGALASAGSGPLLRVLGNPVG